MPIEQEFFEVFGIEPELNCENCHKYNDGESLYGDKGGCYDGSKETKKCYSLYPPITPEIVLELMQIILEYIDKNNCQTLHINDGQFYFDFYSVSGENIKECTLLLCIELKDEIQDQVKALFKC